MKIQSTITHKNGGLEQALLEAVNHDGLLSEADQERLRHLQGLPQDRTEVLNTYEVKNMEDKIEVVERPVFEERLSEYRQQNKLADKIITIRGSWENLPTHLIEDLFKRMGCKPLINKY